jgi:hypothetical protein
MDLTAIRAITNRSSPGNVSTVRRRSAQTRERPDASQTGQRAALLIVDDSVEAAEAIVSGLRNAGIAVRVARPESETDLPALLGGPLDLVIAARDARQTTLAAPCRRSTGAARTFPS